MQSNFVGLELGRGQPINVGLPDTLRMGSITLPDFLEQPTGLFHLDVLPVVTLLVTGTYS